MDAIALHLKLSRGVKDDTLAYVVRNHIKVAQISLGYNAHLNLDKMTARATTVYAMSNF